MSRRGQQAWIPSDSGAVEIVRAKPPSAGTTVTEVILPVRVRCAVGLAVADSLRLHPSGEPAYRFLSAAPRAADVEVDVKVMLHDAKRVLIVGDGPVGLLCALLLGRHGPSVRLFDLNVPQEDPRVATTHPATLDILSETGLVEVMTRAGLVSAGLAILGQAEQAASRRVRPCLA
jgi:hypothetical protein